MNGHFEQITNSIAKVFKSDKFPWDKIFFITRKGKARKWLINKIERFTKIWAKIKRKHRIINWFNRNKRDWIQRDLTHSIWANSKSNLIEFDVKNQVQVNWVFFKKKRFFCKRPDLIPHEVIIRIDIHDRFEWISHSIMSKWHLLWRYQSNS